MAEIGVRRYEESDAPAWDACVADSVNGTLFHSRRFLAYHPAERFDDHSLVFHKRGRLVALFPAAIVLEKDRPVLKSHPGASYGGFVLARAPGVRDAFQLCELLLAWAGEEGVERVALRTAPRIYDRAPCEEVEFALSRSGFKQEQRELSSCFDLGRLRPRDPSKATPEQDDRFLGLFRPAAARATRRALASGLEARWCEQEVDFRSYWEMLAANLARHDAEPTHTQDELWDLHETFPGDVRLLGIFESDLMVAGLVTFVGNAQTAHVFYFASSPAHQDQRPLNLAVLALLRWAEERGLRYVNFGISTERGGSVVNWGLFRFKESFGAGGTLRTLWVKDL